MYRLPRTLSVFAGLFLFVFAGCEWDPTAEHQDVICDAGGCYTCEEGLCATYHCFQDHQCPRGRICTEDNICLASEDEAQMTESGRTCRPTTHCDSGGNCISGTVCTSTPVADELAAAAADAPSDAPANSAPASSPDNPVETSGAGAGSDDAPNAGSEGETGADSGVSTIALPAHPDDQCVVNDDCGFTGICLNAGCYFPCDAIGECPPDQQCDGGQCLPTDSPEVTCTFNGECGPSRVCIEGQCFATCAESLDCSDTMVCSEGLCLADTSPVIQCSGSGACGDDEGCFDGKCLPLCDASRPCTAGGLCQYGYCHQKVTCTLSEQCASGLQCLDGDCAAVSVP